MYKDRPQAEKDEAARIIRAMLQIPGVEVLQLWNGGDAPECTTDNPATLYRNAGETDHDVIRALGPRPAPGAARAVIATAFLVYGNAPDASELLADYSATPAMDAIAAGAPGAIL